MFYFKFKFTIQLQYNNLYECTKDFHTPNNKGINMYRLATKLPIQFCF